MGFSQRHDVAGTPDGFMVFEVKDKTVLAAALADPAVDLQTLPVATCRTGQGGF